MRKMLNSRICFNSDESVAAASVEPVVVDPQLDDIGDLLSNEPAPMKPAPVVEPVVAPVAKPAPASVSVELVTPVVVEPVAPVVAPVVEPAPSTPPSREAELEAQVARLTALVEKMASGPQPVQPPVAASTSVATPVQVQPIPPQGLNLVEMFKETDLSTVMDSKEGFLGFMQKILDTQAEMIQSQMLTRLPAAVTPVISTYQAQRDLATEFYGKHKHLSRIKGYVGRVAAELAEVHKDKTLEEILNLTAAQVNAEIGFKEVAGDSGTEIIPPVIPATPVLPGATGGVRTKPAPSNSLQDEIADLISN